MACLAGVLALVWLFGRDLAAHTRTAADSFAFTRDATQHVAPYLRYRPASPLHDDFITRYLQACHPVGYRLLLTAWSSAADPRPLCKVLQYACLAALTGVMAVAVYPVGGLEASWLIAALVLSGTIFLDRMMGGLPRAFAFPLSAVVLAGVLRGRVRWIAAGCILAAAFYPSVAVVGGITLAMLLALTRWSGMDAAGWSWPHRLAGLAGLAALLGLLACPSIVATRPFGPLLDRDGQREYPEAGPKGRGGRHVSIDYQEDVLPASISFMGKALLNEHAWIVKPTWRHWRHMHQTVALVLLAGWLMAVPRSEPARRLLLAAVGTCVAYELSIIAVPHLYLPDRYLLFSMPLIVLLAIPFALDSYARIAERLARRRIPRPAVTWAGAAVLLALCGGRINPAHGMTVCPPATRELMAAIDSLPAESVVAGWPSHVDFVTYLTGRAVLLSTETHLPYHRAYLDELRMRMRTLMAALYARSPEPLAALQARYGVTHLVVKRRDFALPAPRYFQPFNEWIAQERGQGPESDLLLVRELGHAAVWHDEETWLVDLARISAPAAGGTSPTASSALR